MPPGSAGAETERSRLRVDVVVVGGGTGGMTAARAAAELGASVVVVELDSAIGGTGVRGGVHFYYHGGKGGLQDDLDAETRRLGRNLAPSGRGFNPTAKQLVAERSLRGAGVRVLTEALVASVEQVEGTILSLDVESTSGPYTLSPTVVVDCTGNGDLAALAGAEYDVGRDWDGVLNAYSLVPRAMADDGTLTFRNFDIGWMDPTDPHEATRAFTEGRRLALSGGAVDRGYLLALGPLLGVREGRRVIGDHVVSQLDLFTERRFSDTVTFCRSHLDPHARDFANESDLAQIWIPVLGWRMRRFDAPIPYRALLPRGLRNVIMGCRALSVDADASKSIRMQRDIHKLGEVAGLAAGMAVRSDRPLRQIEIRELQQLLIDRGLLPGDWRSRGGRGPVNELDDEPGTALSARLGTETESEALWQFYRRGAALDPQTVRDLEETIDDPTTEGSPRRRGAALALGLSGRASAAAELARIVASADHDVPGSALDLGAPRWVAALVVLRLLQSPSALPIVVQRVGDTQDPGHLLYLLHYLIAIVGQLDTRQRAQVRVVTRALLSRAELGDDYRLQTSMDVGPGSDPRQSLRWSLELTAAHLLDRLGDPVGADLRQHYREDRRGHVRRFVRLLDERARRLRPEPRGTDRRRTVEQPGYDLIVAGGGLGGLAAALTASRAGWRTVLTDSTGALGREITRSRLLDLGPGFFADDAGQELQAALRAAGALRGRIVDAVAAGGVFDDLCAAAGIDVRLQAMPAHRLPSGLRIAVSTGYEVLKAPWVVDLTPFGVGRHPEAAARLSAFFLRSPAGRVEAGRLGRHLWRSEDGAVAYSVTTGVRPDEVRVMLVDTHALPAGHHDARCLDLFDHLQHHGYRGWLMSHIAEEPLPLVGPLAGLVDPLDDHDLIVAALDHGVQSVRRLTHDGRRPSRGAA